MRQPQTFLFVAYALLAALHVAAGSNEHPLTDTGNEEEKPGILTTEQVDAFVRERVDAEGNVAHFGATFRQVTKLSAEAIQKFRSSETIPFQITAWVDLHSQSGKRIGRAEGDFNFYVLDADGNVVVTAKSSSKQMCPT